jgi:hypothetical protein
MELEELDITELRTSSVSQGPPVGGGDFGVRGDGVQLPHAAGGEDYCWCANGRPGAATGEGANTDDTAFMGQKAGDLGVLQDLNLGKTPNHFG